MDIPEYKTCSRCKQVLPAVAFSRSGKQKSGLQSHCKACQKIRRRKYYVLHQQGNPDVKRRRRETDAQWNEKHKDDIEVHAIIRAKQKIRDRRFRANHQDDPAYRQRKRAKNRRYYQRHRESFLEKNRLAAIKNRLRDRPKRAVREQRRRANKANAPINDLTRQQWAAIKRHYGQRCVYCNLKTRKLTMDHIVPLSKGGSHTANNVVPACLSCNSRKRDGAPPIPVQPLLFAPPNDDDKDKKAS